MKRTSNFIPKIKKWLPKELAKYYDIPSLSSQYIKACASLANIQEYHDIDLSDITQGIIRNIPDGRIFLAKSGLDSSDLFNIGKEARKFAFFDGAVKWFIAAIKKANIENQSKDYCKRIKYGIYPTL